MNADISRSISHSRRNVSPSTWIQCITVTNGRGRAFANAELIPLFRIYGDRSLEVERIVSLNTHLHNTGDWTANVIVRLVCDHRLYWSLATTIGHTLLLFVHKIGTWALMTQIP